MREIIIKSNDANQRLDKFISKYLKTLPKSLMYKYIRNKKIKVNGKRAVNNQFLNEGDMITFHISEEFFESKNDSTFLNSKGDVSVVYEDENILIMDKEVGLLCQSDINEETTTLVNQMKKYLFKKGEFDYMHEQSFTPSLCNRLDRNTSGLVIGAKNASSVREINRLIKEGDIHKYYLTICEGKLKGKGEYLDYHQKDGLKITISNKDLTGYKKIRTSYEVIETSDDYSLVEVELHTGKMHQIRAQFAYHHHPLLGDKKYHSKNRKFNYQLLRAYKLKFKVDEKSSLSYLNNKEIKINNDEIKAVFYSL